MTITREQFIQATGRTPGDDDLLRVNCELAGEVLHWACGWCEEHNGPMFACLCYTRQMEARAVGP